MRFMEIYAMNEFDLYVGNNCRACEMLKSQMSKKDRDRCVVINADDPSNYDKVYSLGISMVPCLVANGMKICGASAILDYLKTH